jgi:hypothetical protein
MKTTILDLAREKELLEKDLVIQITEFFKTFERGSEIDVMEVDINLQPPYTFHKAQVTIKIGIKNK